MNRRAVPSALLSTLPAALIATRSAAAARNPALFVAHPYDTPSWLYARFRPLTLRPLTL
jgi:hypothetical protein